jgi:ribonuclease E
MLKDVTIASRLARAYGFLLPATEAARDSLVAEARQGRGDYDYASIVANFFPEGLPGQAAIQEPEAEEQTTLSGLDHESAESERASERREEEASAPSLVEEQAPEPPAIEPEASVAKDDAPEAEPEAPVPQAQASVIEAETFVVEPEVAVINAEPPRTEESAGAEESREHERLEAPMEPAEPAMEMSNIEAPQEREVAASAADEPQPKAPVEAPPKEPENAEEPEEPRGFLARLFGKGDDY